MGAKRILIVEDDTTCREALEQLLQNLGFETQSCSCGREAMAILETQIYDILITDFQMPGMNGLELIGKAREISPNLAIVLVSGLPQEEFRTRLGKTGVNGFLTKPLDWAELSFLLGKLSQEKGHGSADSKRGNSM